MELYKNKDFKTVSVNGREVQVPEDWEVKKLSELFEIKKGEQLNKSEFEENKGSYPFYNGGISPSGYINKSNVDGNNIRLSEGGASSGYVDYIKEDYWSGGHNYTLFTDKNKKYLYFILKNNQNKLFALQTGTGLPNINKKNLSAFEIFISKDKEEQNRIVTVLTKQDELIEAKEKLIEIEEKKKTFLQQEILFGRLRIDENGKFYENEAWKTELVNGKSIEIPEDWKVSKIIDNVNFIKGKAIAEKLLNREEQGYIYLKTTELWLDSASKRETLYYDGDIEDKYIKNEDEYVFSLDGFNSEIGKGTLGLVSREGKGIVSTHFHKIEKNNIYELMINILKSNYIQSYIINLGEGTTVKSANKYLKIIECFLPSDKEEQKRISNLFKDQENKIKLIKEDLKIEKKKQKFLQQELLTGRIRIKEVK